MSGGVLPRLPDVHLWRQHDVQAQVQCSKGLAEALRSLLGRSPEEWDSMVVSMSQYVQTLSASEKLLLEETAIDLLNLEVSRSEAIQDRQQRERVVLLFKALLVRN